MGGDTATLSIGESVTGIVERVEAPPRGGHHFIDYQGNILPW
jgi:hypothetical protein